MELQSHLHNPVYGFHPLLMDLIRIVLDLIIESNGSVNKYGSKGHRFPSFVALLLLPTLGAPFDDSRSAILDLPVDFASFYM